MCCALSLGWRFTLDLKQKQRRVFKLLGLQTVRCSNGQQDTYQLGPIFEEWTSTEEAIREINYRPKFFKNGRKQSRVMATSVQVKLTKSLIKCRNSSEIFNIVQQFGPQFDSINAATAFYRLAKIPEANFTSNDSGIQYLLDLIYYHLSNMNGQSLGNIAWAHGRRGHGDDNLLFAIVSRGFEFGFDMMRDQEVSNILWACSRLQINPDNIFERLIMFLKADVKNFSPQAMCLVSYSYACVRIYNRNMFNVLGRYLSVNVDRLDPQQLSLTVWAFSQFNHFHLELFAAILIEILNKQLNGFNYQDLDQLMTSFAKLYLTISRQSEQFDKQNVHLLRHFLLQKKRHVLNKRKQFVVYFFEEAPVLITGPAAEGLIFIVGTVCTRTFRSQSSNTWFGIQLCVVEMKYNCVTHTIWGVLLILCNSVSGQDRVTISGATCSFPQIYNKVFYEDCFEVDGVQMCQINGSLEECVPIGGATSPAVTPTPVDAGSRKTVDGRDCIFPFTYRQVMYTDCLVISGKEQCRLDGTLVECAPVSGSLPANPSTPTPSPAPTPSPSPIISSNVPAAAGTTSPASSAVSRTTTDGQACVFPFTYRSVSYTDCLVIAGKEQCQINDQWFDCTPTAGGSATPTPTPTTSPTPSPTRTTSPTPSPTPATPSASTSSRTTTTGLPCEFPFDFGPASYTDCVPVGDTEYCFAGGDFLECAPASSPPPPSQSSARKAITGADCDTSYFYQGTQYSGCLTIDSAEYCKVAGILYPCLPEDGGVSSLASPPLVVNNPAAAQQSPDIVQPPESIPVNNPSAAQSPGSSPPVTTTTTTSKERFTMDGQQCQFPFIYRRVGYNDCLYISDREQCQINRQWYDCAPAGSTPPVVSSNPPVSTPTPSPAPEEAAQRITISGALCEFPYTYRNQEQYGCIIISGKEQCKVGGKFEECALLLTAPVPTAPNSPTLTNGESGNNGGGSKNSLSSGAIAGIVVAVFFVVVLVTLGVLYYLQLKRAPQSQQFVKFDEPIQGVDDVNGMNGGVTQSAEEEPSPEQPKAFV
eukprot:TRINITY_DN4390_c0_g2_i1.p1 TRINITY_DN4390_c0_g2~~TRINITY_DN4390_c0_g2_i1.p1  ORF type:complete len:1038 (-),score=85.36 TRINITY_DN4390_c0_g2_i1:594-3707(-)